MSLHDLVAWFVAMAVVVPVVYLVGSYLAWRDSDRWRRMERRAKRGLR